MASRAAYTIGSSSECDLVVNDGRVSGRHCRLTARKGMYLLEDLGSTNGTFVNGVRITEPTIVSTDDDVTLGREVPLPWPRAENRRSAKKPRPGNRASTGPARPSRQKAASPRPPASPPPAAHETPPPPKHPQPPNEPDAAPPAEPPGRKPIPDVDPISMPEADAAPGFNVRPVPASRPPASPPQSPERPQPAPEPARGAKKPKSRRKSRRADRPAGAKRKKPRAEEPAPAADPLAPTDSDPFEVGGWQDDEPRPQPPWAERGAAESTRSVRRILRQHPWEIAAAACLLLAGALAITALVWSSGGGGEPAVRNDAGEVFDAPAGE